MESKDRYTNMVLKYSLNDRLDDIDIYINELLCRSYKTFQNMDDINDEFKDNEDALSTVIGQDGIENLRYYTGIAFRNVNAVLRNNWSYDVNGELTSDKQIEFRELARSISDSINKSGKELSSDIIVYRGVSRSAFKNFGINFISDLILLKDQFVYDSGFVSTSLIRDKSFFDRELEYHDKCNIEIEYLIPNECADGIPLINSDLSYNSDEQTEYLINSGNLSKVIDVKFNEDKSKAYIKMAYIPKKVWDKTYGISDEKVSL